MEVTITLDIVRRLRFDVNALADADHLLRCDLAEVARAPRVSDIRILLWAGLKWEDRRLTLEQVGLLMGADLKKPDGLRLSEMWQRIDDAITAAGPFGPSGNAEPERAPVAPPLSGNGLLKPSAPPMESSDSTPTNSSA